MVPVLGVDDDGLVLERLAGVPPTAASARAFGAALARTHAAGAPSFGAPPAGWDGDGFLGPLSEPLPLPLRPTPCWGRFWAEQRLMPLARLARDRGALDSGDVVLVEAVAARCEAGEYDTGHPPARLHGDLWSGNVMWTADAAVLIDPAAHGGHPETDLAMMALFGFPHLGDALAGYDDVTPATPGRAERVGLHQLHPLLLHAAVFGPGYAGMVRAAAAAHA